MAEAIPCSRRRHAAIDRRRVCRQRPSEPPSHILTRATATTAIDTDPRTSEFG